MECIGLYEPKVRSVNPSLERGSLLIIYTVGGGYREDYLPIFRMDNDDGWEMMGIIRGYAFNTNSFGTIRYKLKKVPL